MANPTACNATVSLALVDGTGAGTAQVSPDSTGRLVATVLGWDGRPVPNATVTFKTSGGVELVPSSGTVATDANGQARVTLPAGTSSGSFTADATVLVNGSELKSTVTYGVVFPALSLALIDQSGTSTTQLSPDNPGTLVATLKYPDGKPVADTIVTFKTSDDVTMVPATRTVLTDAKGQASIALPAGTHTGGFTAEASATRSVSLRSAVNYSVAFPTLTLSVPSIVPAVLSANGTGSISVAVTHNGALYGRPLPVTFTSPCVSAGKATLTPMVNTREGVATATYVDTKGCAASDPITASVTIGDQTTTRTGSIVVSPATAGSIQFVAADSTNIALVGTGGIGRQEASQLKFRVLDAKGSPVAGTDVRFAFADKNNNDAFTVGGLNLLPATATTDADGFASTMVSGGTIPTSVRVKASTGSVTTLSNVLVVSTGVPNQDHFSLATSIGNCEGKDFAQFCSTITVTMADHFGNPVPDGTAVNFSAEGGLIDAACVTGTLPAGTSPVSQTTNSQLGPGSGSCSVTLRSATPRPTNGRVTVLAYAQGEESFDDKNGNNLCDDCDVSDGQPHAEFTAAFDRSPDIFRDDDENGIWSPGEPCIGPNDNKQCSTLGDKVYTGLRRNPQATPSQTVYVSDQLVVLLSGSRANIGFLQGGLSCQVNELMDVQFTVKDDNGNPMPANTLIEVATVFSTGSSQVTPASHVVASYPLKVTGPAPVPVYTSTVICPTSAITGRLSVKVTTPNNVISTASTTITVH